MTEYPSTDALLKMLKQMRENAEARRIYKIVQADKNRKKAKLSDKNGIICHAASLSWKGKRARLWLPAGFCTYMRENKINHVLLLNDGFSGRIVLKPLRESDLDKIYTGDGEEC